MNAISKLDLIKEDLHDFLEQSLSSDDFQVFALAGDASSRKYYRIVKDEVSYVLMCWEPFVDDDKYPFLSVLRHFKEAGVHVPKVIAKAPNKGLVLLEDLGDLTLERKFWESSNPDDVLPYYKLAIDEIVKVHYKATSLKGSCTALQVAFDVDKFVWELNYAKEHYLQKFLGLELSEKEQFALKNTFHEIASILHKEPKVICHRDYHSRNLMFKLAKMYVIDFQDARLGPIQYDLVSLLKDSYVDLDVNTEKAILAYYFAKAIDAGAEKQIESDDFYRIYSVQIIQRCFKACGSFASFYNLRGDTRYLKYIKKTTETVVSELQTLRAFDPLLEVFEKRVLGHPNYDKL